MAVEFRHVGVSWRNFVLNLGQATLTPIMWIVDKHVDGGDDDDDVLGTLAFFGD